MDKKTGLRNGYCGLDPSGKEATGIAVTAVPVANIERVGELRNSWGPES